jgi:hypothetical protein
MAGRRRATELLATVAAVCACLGPASAAASETGSSAVGASIGFGFDTEFGGQTFTVPASPSSDDLLHTLEFRSVTRPAGSFRVYVTALDGSNLPTGAPLFQSSQMAGPLNSATVRVNPNIVLTPGVDYGFYTESPNGTSFGGALGNPYAEGAGISKGLTSGVWTVAGVDLGFRAQFNAGVAGTTTTIDCPDSATIGVPSTCDVVVTDSSASFGTPSGQIGFSTIGGNGSFDGCGSLDASGECSGTYTPDPNSSGSHTLFAQYLGDSSHLQSGTNTAIGVSKRESAQSGASCAPASVTVGQSVTCSVTVTDEDAGTVTTPTGAANWSSSGAGSFAPGNACALTAQSLGTARCAAITYTPTAPGSHAIASSYGGDGNHLSAGPLAAGTVSVAAAPVSESAQCAPLRSKLKGLKRKLGKAESPEAKRKLRGKVKRTRGQLSKLGC